MKDAQRSDFNPPIIFGETTIWLIIGMLIIFAAGTVFGRMTDSKIENGGTGNSQSQQVVHNDVYGRYGKLRWAR